ncbi:MAG: translocation/assembly module TamB domain-containing protein [Calditrichaceae bacterium]
MNIPGLMLEDDNAKLSLTGLKENEKFYFAGPTKHPRLRGTVSLYDSRFTFPFLTTTQPGKKESIVVEFLENINWDILVKSGEDVVYFREIPAYIDKVYTEAYIDEASEGIHFEGIINKGTFKPIGIANSNRGRLEYLDQNFRVERFEVEFTQNDLLPYVSGRAWTSVRDSVGAIPRTIYLQLYVIDPETGEEKQQGSWEDFKFKLVSADPQLGETQESVLASLGFSVGNIKDKATSVGGAVTERILIRPLLRPIERALEKGLGVDLVRINSNIARNLFYSSIGDEYNRMALNPVNGESPYLFLMQSSEFTLGKYISQDLYLTYTGQLVSLYDQTETSFDFNHSIGIEYRFLRNILLEIEYDRELMGYMQIPNQKQYLEDIKIRLRHSFAF